MKYYSVLLDRVSRYMIYFSASFIIIIIVVLLIIFLSHHILYTFNNLY